MTIAAKKWKKNDPQIAQMKADKEIKKTRKKNDFREHKFLRTKTLSLDAFLQYIQFDIATSLQAEKI